MYIDSLSSVAYNYVSRFNAFLFDLSTSLPWSYLDMYADQVRVGHGCDRLRQTASLSTRLSWSYLGMYADQVRLRLRCTLSLEEGGRRLHNVIEYRLVSPRGWPCKSIMNGIGHAGVQIRP